MKRFILFSLAYTLIVFVSNSFVNANILHDETASFKVYGNCEMCKKRIETALLKNQFIKSANWNIQSKILTVTYDPHMIGLDDIYQLVTEVGHDTDKIKTTDSNYKKLADCCQYKRAK